MATRLSDTDKWKNPWYRALPTKYKLLFLYLLDNCDNAGVMHLDLDFICLSIKEEFDLEEIKKLFEKQIVFVADDKIVIKNFVRHQKNSDNPKMQINISNLLKKHGILDRYMRGEFG